MGLIQTTFSKFYEQELPFVGEEIFETQKDFLFQMLQKYKLSPLYQKLSIKQEQLKDLDESQLKEYLSHVEILDYKKHIYPFVQKGFGITALKADLHIRTSGTSDAKSGGKLIPAQRSSLDSERLAIQRTLAYYVSENPHTKIFLPYAFSLTAPFDEEQNIGYVSGSLRKANKLVGWTMLPSQHILRIKDNQTKREAIVKELLERFPLPYVRSIHGVPSWPLAIIDMLIKKDKKAAKRILSRLEYVSIGGGAPQDYKQQFQKRLEKLGLKNQIAGSNNHNASEGFLGAQVRNFFDLDFQWMTPLYKTNFFLFVPEKTYTQRQKEEITHEKLIRSSKFLHEVVPKEVYFMLFANDRIPWLYDLKDKVHFKLQNQGDPLEYEVLGRYSMSSNLMNEHLESDTIQEVLAELIQEGYKIVKDAFVAGMRLEKSKTSASFHMILEGEHMSQEELERLTQRFDKLLGVHNRQWEFFRENNTRITNCSISIRPEGFIREAMIQTGLGHEQSKIPLLSDNNYEAIVEPLLQIKKLQT